MSSATVYWFVDTDLDGGTDIRAVFGVDGASPVPADYDGDGATDFAVFDHGTWRVRRGPNDIFIPYGRDGDVPIPGDYDGDGIADFAVFRPQSASWFVDTNRNGGTDLSVVFGRSGDVPLREGGWMLTAAASAQ